MICNTGNLTNAPDSMATTNYFDELFFRLNGGGVPVPVAVERVATAYLDGKPLPVGKKRLGASYCSAAPASRRSDCVCSWVERARYPG